MIFLLFKDGGKNLSVGWREKQKDELQRTSLIFKTMQGVYEWIGPFDIVFAAYYLEFLFGQVLCYM